MEMHTYLIVGVVTSMGRSVCCLKVVWVQWGFSTQKLFKVFYKHVSVAVQSVIGIPSLLTSRSRLLYFPDC